MPVIPGVAVHVSGPAILKVAFAAGAPGPGGQLSYGALQQLGVSESGVDIVYNVYDEPIMADTAGQRVQADLQEMGKDAELSARLVFWDSAVLDALLQHADNIFPGTLGTIGLPIGASGTFFKLVIASDLDRPRRFFTTILRGPQREKVGTKNTPFDVHFYAWPLVLGSDLRATGKKLFDYTDG